LSVRTKVAEAVWAMPWLSKMSTLVFLEALPPTDSRVKYSGRVSSPV
jgi:hypothetical protein